jgi:hypothetical protein|eukprot:5893502-Prymnesium_polylepis.2
MCRKARASSGVKTTRTLTDRVLRTHSRRAPSRPIAHTRALCTLRPRRTHAQGDVINDHDIALGYVLDHHAEHLPSFAMLPAEQQKSVRFTQSKMGFNHGWLVQARVPH